MIPQKLALLNFMCYRQVEVDFSGIHVACMSGDNGAGKSALLDGVTWALWGKARARRDDELIRLGQDEMGVDFSFRLGNDLYRVVRRRRGGKRSTTMLDLQVQDKGRWRSLSESTVRATQERIEHLLRLDYDTFVNSAFLRQGRADEFTVKTPAERKRVLGEILGLDQWRVYEERAKEYVRRYESEARALEMRLQEIAEELLHRDEYQEQVRTTQMEVEECTVTLQEAQSAWQAMEALRGELRHNQLQAQEANTRLIQAHQERAALTRERRERQARLLTLQQLLDEAQAIEAGFAAYETAQEQERVLGEKLTALADLNERRSTLETQVAEVRHSLQTRRELTAQQVSDLAARQPTPAMIQQLDELQARQTHLLQLRESQQAARVDLARLAEERAALQRQNQALKPEMETLKERIDRLQGATAHCPLCGQPLPEGDRRRLIAQLEEEGRQRGDAYRANRVRLEAIAGEAAALEMQIAQSEPLLRELPLLEQRAAMLAAQIAAGEASAAGLETARTALAALEAQLADEDYAPAERQALAGVLAEAAELGYDAVAHEAARRAVTAGQVWAERKAQLDVASSTAAQEQTALERLATVEQRWSIQEQAALAQLAGLKQQATELEEQMAAATVVEERLGQVRVAEAQARQRLGAAQQRLAACEALARQQESRLQRRQELDSKLSLYEELRTAFGVQGVPAMVIEAAVPEIEAEANRLLARMTAGRMHVRLETQRETLAGELRETLDIRIMDELGERPYENYSGGEQFRINFALRIALSRLLARRAGAQLSTLIVDEGFGTQDAQGRERLVETIQAIQDEFERVLVITHVEELRDAFPVRIEVTKTAEGSIVELL